MSSPSSDDTAAVTRIVDHIAPLAKADAADLKLLQRTRRTRL